MIIISFFVKIRGSLIGGFHFLRLRCRPPLRNACSCPPKRFPLSVFPCCCYEEPLGLNDLPPAFTPSSTLLATASMASSDQLTSCLLCTTMARVSRLCRWGHGSHPLRNGLESIFEGGALLFSVAAATPCQCPHKVDGFRAPQRSLLMWAG